jgi:hypothetical protein
VETAACSANGGWPIKMAESRLHKYVPRTTERKDLKKPEKVTPYEPLIEEALQEKEQADEQYVKYVETISHLQGTEFPGALQLAIDAKRLCQTASIEKFKQYVAYAVLSVHDPEALLLQLCEKYAIPNGKALLIKIGLNDQVPQFMQVVKEVVLKQDFKILPDGIDCRYEIMRVIVHSLLIAEAENIPLISKFEKQLDKVMGMFSTDAPEQ